MIEKLSREEIVRAWQDVFSHPKAAIVLEDLRRSYGFTCLSEHPTIMAYRAGQRELVDQIHYTLALDPRLIEQQTQPSREEPI